MSDILIISHRVPYPPNKGEKIRTFHQLVYLLEHNHRLHICAPITDRDDIEHLNDLVSKYKLESTFSIIGLKALRLLLGLIKNKPLSISNFYSKSLQRKIDSLLTSNKFDAILCTSSSMAEYIFQSSAINFLSKRPKLIMDFMDIDSEKWSQYAKISVFPLRWIYTREARLLTKYEKRVQSTFDASFLISDAEVKLFCKIHLVSSKVHILGNGIDSTFFTPGINKPENKEPVFLFTGVMDYKPNIDAVIWFVETVWPGIIKHYPEARFIVAGMNPTLKVSKLGNISGIEITGFVDDILPYYHKSDIFVAPLRIARGVQNKVLQAFACGLPVISTSMGAEGIDCTDGIDIHLADSTEEFVKGINLLINNKKYRNSIREKALALVQDKYSWQGKLKVLDSHID